MKEPTSAFTLKTLLRQYAKQSLTYDLVSSRGLLRDYEPSSGPSFVALMSTPVPGPGGRGPVLPRRGAALHPGGVQQGRPRLRGALPGIKLRERLSVQQLDNIYIAPGDEGAWLHSSIQ